MAKRKLVDKPRNAGTMTESAFWGFIRSTLRRKSMYWKPITECKNNARRPYKGTNKRRKWEYQCNTCKKWFDGKETVVDHIIPAGSLTCAEDLPSFVNKLFCEIEDLQCQCKGCHAEKTIKDNIETKKSKKVGKTIKK